MRGFIGLRPVIAIELPSHGESDDPLKASASIGDYAKVVHQALACLKLDRVDVVGLGFGGLVGLDLALRHRRLINALAMVGVADLEGRDAKEFVTNGASNIEPDWFGGHLFQAWHVARDQGLFWPWYKRLGSSAIRQEPQIDPDRIQQRLLDLLRSNGGWQRAFRAQFSYPWRTKLQLAMRNSALRVVLAASALDPLQNSTWRVADAVPGVARLPLPKPERLWAASIVKEFERGSIV
jgi:pimeloyl-ACP methyl ester carboxylesterase